MKDDLNWKKFAALFMAIAMVFGSGIFVTTQSFKAGEDSDYDSEVDYEEEEIALEDEEDALAEEEPEETEGEEAAEEAVSEETAEGTETAAAEAGGVGAGEQAAAEQTAEEKGEITGSVKLTFNLNGAEGEEPPEMTASRFANGELDEVTLPEPGDWTDANGTVHSFVGWNTEEGATEAEDTLTAEEGEEEVELFVWEENAEATAALAAERAAEEEAAAEEQKAEQAAAEEQAAAPDEAAAEQANAALEEAQAEEPAEGTPADAEGTEEAAATEKAAATEEAAEAKEPLVDEEGYLLGEDGMRLKDENGEWIKAEDAQAAQETEATSDESTPKVDEEGYLLDENGNRILDENGNPIKAEDAYSEEALAALQEEELMKAMPAGEASGSAGNVSVEASWEVGVLPAGVTMEVTEVSQEEALEAVGDAVKDATEAYAVDISFYTEAGEKVEPQGDISVSMMLDTPLMGDNVELVHVDDSGDASTVSADVSETGAYFSASEFSIYVLTGNGTNNTNYENRTFDYSMDAYQGLTLAEDVVDSRGKYIGGKWEIKDQHVGIKVAGAEEGSEEASSDEKVIDFMSGAELEPETSEERKTVGIRTSGSSGEATVTYTYKVGNKEVVDTYTIHIKGYTAHFDVNGGEGSVDDVSVTMNSSNKALIQMPSGEGLSRDGYELVGWTTVKDAMTAGRGWGYHDYKYIFDLDDGDNATLNDTYCWDKGAGEEITFYAAWAPTRGVSSQIGFYVRKDGTIQTEPASYPANQYVTVTPTGSYTIYADLAEYISLVKTETDISKIRSRITTKAWDDVCDYIDDVHKAHQENPNNADLAALDLLEKYPGLTNTESRYGNVPSSGYYIVWYVSKDQSGVWHVDGAIRGKSAGSGENEKALYNLDYHTNCNDYSGQAPDSKQYKEGTEVTIAGNNTLARTGYTFAGWNTKANGKGFGYQEGKKITMTENVDLYAQWIPNSDTPYTLLGYDSETGEEITNARKVRKGTTGNTVSANDSDKELPGYVFDRDNKQNKLEATIEPDGKTTLILYFKRTAAIEINMAKIGKTYDKQPVSVGFDSVKVNGSNAKEYRLDGSNLIIKQGEHTYTVSGLTFEIKANNEKVDKAINAGTYDVVASGTASVSENGKTRMNITVETNKGQITIAKKSLTIRTADLTKGYDGKVLTNPTKAVVLDTNSLPEGVSVPQGKGRSAGVVDGLVQGDALPELTFTGSIKAPGEVDNAFDESALDALRTNYEITTAFGKLTVTDANTKYQINVRANAIEAVYDGTEHRVAEDGYVLEGAQVSENSQESRSFLSRLGDFISGEGAKTSFKIGNEAFSISGLKAVAAGEVQKFKDAGTYEDAITVDVSSVKIVDSENHDVTRQFVVTPISANVVIEKRNVVMRSASLTKVYDSEALTNPGENPHNSLEVQPADGVSLAKNDKEEELQGYVGAPTNDKNGGFIDGEGATYTFDRSLTKAGRIPNEFSYTLKNGTNENNYNITKEEGYLEITNPDAKFDITVTPNGSKNPNAPGSSNPEGTDPEEGENAESGASEGTPNGGVYTYDGTQHSVSGFVADGKEYENGKPVPVVASDGKTYYVSGITAGASGTDAGSYKVSVNAENLKIEDKNGNDVTELFNVSYKNAYLVINKRPLALKSASLTKPYDGTPLVNPDNNLKTTIPEGSPITIDQDGQGYVNGLVQRDTLAITFTGTRTVKGTDTVYNTYTYTINGQSGENIQNYNVTAEFGTLTIGDRGEGNKYEITIIGKTEGGGTPETPGGSDTSDDSETPGGSNTPDDSGTPGTADTTGGDMSGTGTIIKYDGETHTVTGFENQGDDGRIPVIVDGRTYYVEGITTRASGTDAGTYEGTFEGEPVVKDEGNNDVTDQFVVNKTPAKLIISPREVSLKSASLSKVYDGSELMNPSADLEIKNEDIPEGITLDANGKIGGDGFVDGEGAAFTFGVEKKLSDGQKVTGRQTVVGFGPNTFDYTLNENTKASNYNITPSYGTLTVTSRGADKRIEIKVTPNGGTYVYDGQEHNPSGFNDQDGEGRIVVKVDGKTYYVTGITSTYSTEESGVPKDANGEGIAPVITGTPVVTDANGNVVTDQFKVDHEEAKLVITKRPITLTSASLTKPYDGKALRNPDNNLATSVPEGSKITITTNGSESTGENEGWVTGEGATYKFTGSAKRVTGTENPPKNTFNVTAQNGTNLDNYAITKQEGTLTITSLTENGGTGTAVTLHVNSSTGDKSITYDGETHTVGGLVEYPDWNGNGPITITINDEEYTIEGLTITPAEGKDVGEYHSSTDKSGLVIKDSDNEIVTNQFSLDVIEGTLTIVKRNVTIKSASLAKVYDAKALKNGDNLEVAEREGVEIIENGSVSGDGWVQGEEPNLQFNGSQTLPNVTADAALDENRTHNGLNTVQPPLNKTWEKDFKNYNITVVPGDLYVKGRSEAMKYEVTVKANDVTDAVYDGQKKSVEKDAFSFVGAEANDAYKPSFFGKIKDAVTKETTVGFKIGEEEFTISGLAVAVDQDRIDAGEYKGAIIFTNDGKHILDKNGDDVSEQFILKKEPGDLTINPAQVTLKSYDLTKAYDGEPLTNASRNKETQAAQLETETGWVGEEGAEYSFTGSQTGIGTSPNAFTVAFKEGTKESNYTIAKTEGTLTVITRGIFNLTIHYVDTEGKTLVADYRDSYVYGDSFYVKTPAVSGYTPNYTYVASDENGMPAKDVEVTVIYAKNEATTGTTGTGSGNNDDKDKDKDKGGNNSIVDNTTPSGGNTGDAYTSDEDEDDDDDDSTSGSGSRSRDGSGGNGTGRDANGGSSSRSRDGSGGNGTGRDANGSSSTENPADTSGDNGTGGGNPARSASGGTQTNDDSDRPSRNRGARITLDENGEPTLVSVSDTETPLFNQGLGGDHKCNVLRLLLLLASFVVVMMHTKYMRERQARIFELREKLEEAKKRK